MSINLLILKSIIFIRYFYNPKFKMIDSDFVIVGAGPSGLTLSYKLLQAGKSVTIIERDKRVGGLAKSFEYEGNIFDLGPKRFHTDDSKVTEFIDSVMDLNIIGRSTLVCFFNRYLDWPLRRRDLLRLPINISIKSGLDILNKVPPQDKTSFKQFIESKYGQTLYKTFFEPYTSKFLRWDPKDLHSDWATTGINRAVIDEEVNQTTDSTLSIVKSLLLPAKVDTKFKYPSKGGFGGFFDILFAKCQEFPSFKVFLNSTLSSIDNKGFNDQDIIVKVNQKEISTKKLIWTGNVNDLNKIITNVSGESKKVPKMHYLNTRFVNFTIKESTISKNKAQWIYISDGSLMTSRITCMKEFNPNTCNSGYYNLICEVTESQDSKKEDRLNKTKLGLKVIDELQNINFIKGQSGIEDFKVEDISDTYPIYSKNYKEKFGLTVRNIKGYSKNIHLLGRSGSFWYNNSDHSIRQALDASKFLLGKIDKELDYRNYFGGST